MVSESERQRRKSKREENSERRAKIYSEDGEWHRMLWGRVEVYSREKPRGTARMLI